jgi:hypothetical protein
MRLLNLLVVGLALWLGVALFVPRSLAVGPAPCEQACVYLPLAITPPTPEGAEIVNLRGIGTRDGWVFEYGEILNTTGGPIHEVMLEVVYTNGSGELLDVSHHTTVLPVVYPGELMVFDGGRYRDDETVDEPPHLETFIISYSPYTADQYQPLTILSKYLVPGEFTFSGELRNDSAYTLQSIKVVIWSPDEFIHPTRGEAMIPVLAPGETATYRVLYNLYDKFDPSLSRMRVAAQGEVVR